MSAADPRRPKRTVWLALSLVPAVTFFGAILYTLPQFKDIYEDIIPGERLPALTAVFWAIPEAVYAVIMVAVVAGVLWANRTIGSPGACLRMHAVVGLLSVTGIVVYAVALFLFLLIGPDGGLHSIP